MRKEDIISEEARNLLEEIQIHEFESSYWYNKFNKMSKEEEDHIRPFFIELKRHNLIFQF